jgi:ubiquinone/menaquinone biosynthesis C-methylase UbiE
MKTNEYYEKHSKEFIDRTVSLDMGVHYEIFERYFKGNKLLDLGFGSGRDSLYFSNEFEVVSGDIVEEFLKNGKDFLQNEIRYVDAVNMDIENEFDGIWACASLLHISTDDLVKVFQNLH